MNQHLKKAVAMATLVVMGGMAAQAPVQAAETPVAQNIWHGADKAYTVKDNLYIPIRDLSSSIGCNIAWEAGTPNNKLVLADAAGVDYQITLDGANQAAITENGSYHYDLKDGRIALPVSFYQDIFNNTVVGIDEKTGALAVHLADPAMGISFNSLSLYQAPVATPEPASVPAAAPAPAPALTYFQSGEASWYGPGLNGNYTASGEIFNMYDLTAAHPSLAFGTRVKVTNQYNGASVIVRINDRGPYAHGRIIDLSMASAQQVGIASSGVGQVTLEIVG